MLLINYICNPTKNSSLCIAFLDGLFLSSPTPTLPRTFGVFFLSPDPALFGAQQIVLCDFQSVELFITIPSNITTTTFKLSFFCGTKCTAD